MDRLIKKMKGTQIRKYVFVKVEEKALDKLVSEGRLMTKESEIVRDSARIGYEAQIAPREKFIP